MLLALTLAGLSSAQSDLAALHDDPAEGSHGTETTLVEQSALSHTPCVSGQAGPYACRAVELLSFVPAVQLTPGAMPQLVNDIWGWTDAESGKEYALVGLDNGTSFVDITNPESPSVIGYLPTHTDRSTWRDIKVHQDHAFIVSEAREHGMQVFDLTQLRAVAAPPVRFTESAHYADLELSNAHNIAIDEGSGFAFIAGSNTCSQGLHIVDVRNPKAPRQAGCFGEDGYVHDAQCVIYTGPDDRYTGREICIAFAEDTVTVVDVTDKGAPRQLAGETYSGVGYTHQGWLTTDQMYLLQDDEADERLAGHNTRTYIWSMIDLERPLLLGVYTGTSRAIDHNLYVREGYAYLANYQAGLRILDLAGIADAELREVGYFDVFPESDAPEFSGAWSVYPFFPSGTVVVSSIERGLFVLQPVLNQTE
jgi:choice-of-anchor B domain-containing protein